MHAWVQAIATVNKLFIQTPGDKPYMAITVVEIIPGYLVRCFVDNIMPTPNSAYPPIPSLSPLHI